MASAVRPVTRAPRSARRPPRGSRLHRSAAGWLRDTTFVVGGGLVIGLGVAFGIGLWWAGAGWLFASAWLGVALTVGFGVFFVYVGLGERRERRSFLERYDPNPPQRPPGRS